MLVKDTGELVERCFEGTPQLLNLRELQDAFIRYVFGDYQERVVEALGMDGFYEHLEAIHLVNCRRDFDLAVEEWYRRHFKENHEKEYHDFLFQLAKEAVATYKSQSREKFIQDLTCLLTSPDGFMQRWKAGGDRTTSMYFSYLHRLGIRSYQDIQSFVDTWLMEHPQAFNQEYQLNFQREARRGRPNNPELTRLIEKINELKPDLTKQEKERIRKIYYYHRKSLTRQAMVEKFLKYIKLKALLQSKSIS